MDSVSSSNQENQLRLTGSQTHVSNCPYTQIQSLKNILITFACLEFKESNSSVRLVENFATHVHTHAISSQRPELSTLLADSQGIYLCVIKSIFILLFLYIFQLYVYLLTSHSGRLGYRELLFRQLLSLLLSCSPILPVYFGWFTIQFLYYHDYVRAVWC